MIFFLHLSGFINLTGVFNSYNLCFTASNKITPAATDTFKEAIFPTIGILTCISLRFKYSLEIPFSSEPIIIAEGFVKSALK